MEEISLKSYAYIGDAVWELFIREQMITRSQKASELHKLTTTYVNASGQQSVLNQITEELTEEESELVRRGRNLSVPSARKSNQSEYRSATGFEVLIGWLYYHNKSRLFELEEKIIKNL